MRKAVKKVKRINKKLKVVSLENLVYVVLFFIISIIPLVFFSERQPLMGNETKAKKPEFLTEEGINLSFPGEFDNYFSQNFGLRSKLVNANNLFKKALFKTSGQSSVIIGEEGWLFYESALKDYVGSELLSEAEIDKLCVIIELMQNYVEGEGKEFIFFLAPNKMSVYGEFMPYYYVESEKNSNYDRFVNELVKNGVNTVDLKTTLHAKKLEGVRLYHKLDSHWNNYGAAVAYETVAEALHNKYGDYSYTKYTDAEYATVNNFSGDLQAMLFPQSKVRDENVEFAIEDKFEFAGNFKAVDDLLINTTNSNALVDKRVTLYRDSFGNSLYYFFANDFAEAEFKREIPYNIYQSVLESDLIAVEIVERNIPNLLKYMPVIPAKAITDSGFFVNEKLESCDGAEVIIRPKNDSLYEITGKCELLKEASEIYLAVLKDGEKILYQVLPAGNECEFTMYLEQAEASMFLEALENVNNALEVSDKKISDIGIGENKITEENPSIIYEKNGVYVEIPLIMTLQK